MNINAHNNKLIAKNTMMLYIRMMLRMIVSLYTSRVVLQTLGVDDFGVYTVVGSVVTMFDFLSSSLGGATSRFITYELGLGEKGNLKRTFRSALTIHYIVAFIVFLFAETIGLWLVADKLVIPEDRIIAAHIVYQCSIITIIIAIISSPFNALIIAYERMSAFAYISIIEVFLKLILVLALGYIGYDKLAIYAVFLLFVQILMRFLYTVYCQNHFSDCSFTWLWDTKKSKEILIYSSWTVNGNLAFAGYTQGINILLNLFFGPVVNAARGIAVQVQTAVSIFFTNFLMAVQPQITKSYASGDILYMQQLIVKSSKVSFYICLLLTLPILINIEYILNLWLGVVPDYTSGFVCILLLASLDETLKKPILMAVHATGNIKKFQLIEGSLLLLILPIVYVGLKWFNTSAYFVFWTYLIIEILTQFVRVWIVYPLVRMRITVYFVQIIIPIFLTCVPLAILYWVLSKTAATNIEELIIQSSLICLATILSIVTLGLSKLERKTLLAVIKSKLRY